MKVLQIGESFSLKNWQLVGDTVFHHQQIALKRGMIPIVGAVIRRLRGNKGRLLGIGSNQLLNGRYGIHGEQGPFAANRLRLRGAAAQCLCYSSLHPCQYCQAVLAHLGFNEVHALDVKTWEPQDTRYAELGIEFVTHAHPACTRLFGRWLGQKTNSDGPWLEDVGIVPGDDESPATPEAILETGVINNLLRMAEIGYGWGEAPIGAALLDRNARVISEAHPLIETLHDSTQVASVAAWQKLPRIDGQPRSWKGTTLFLTSGPCGITEGMFRGFRFGQLMVLSSRVYPGQIQSLRRILGQRLVVVDDPRADRLLERWFKEKKDDPWAIKEHFGANWIG